MKMFKVFFDIEEEEKWLNEQLQKGYRCTKISVWGVYTFRITDKRYVMRLDYQGYMAKKKLEEYKGTYEDFGWDYIKGSGIWPGRIRYWQKEEGDQNELFSDRQSRGNYYKRLMVYSFMLGMPGLIYLFLLYRDSGGIYHEELWGMQGSLFWIAFLFETPFALLKLLPVLMVVFIGCSFYKNYQKYSMLKD